MKTTESLCAFGSLVLAATSVFPSTLCADVGNVSLHNEQLRLTTGERGASYQIWAAGSERPVLSAIFGAEIDHQWMKSTNYPRHEISQSRFVGSFGPGRQITLLATGLAKPDLVCILRLYDRLPFGELEVEVQNTTHNAASVQSVRSVEAVGKRLVELGRREGADRVLSDVYSFEGMQIYDLGQAPNGLHWGAWDQLIYNRESGQSVFFGALTSNRFVTVLRLRAEGENKNPKITSYTIDSTGTSEAMRMSANSYLKQLPKEDQIELSVPLPPGKSVASESLMFAVGGDYHAQLESYASALEILHRPRWSTSVLMGWEPEKIYDPDITEGYLLTNAQWLAKYLKPLGFNYIHSGNGYQYAWGDPASTNSAKFPRGLGALKREMSQLGLRLGGFVVPFHVEGNSWVYEHHKGWLVRNARGKAIRITSARQTGTNGYVLDTTHPEAQAYLRELFRNMVRNWGWSQIQIDGMDYTAIEGYRYRPNVTALEAHRIGMQVIREAVGNDVLLTLATGPWLNAVGFVDLAGITDNTVHLFSATKRGATVTAAHYYTHRHLWAIDPDTFNVQREVPGLDSIEGPVPGPLTLSEAQASIVLAAMCGGGAYDIGDDLPTLGTEPERLTLVTNPSVLQMAKLGHVAKPLDLMTYRPEDEQPSIFLLREDQRQSMLAVFNWTEQPKSHAFTLSDLGLPTGHAYHLYDALNGDKSMAFGEEAIHVDGQTAHSVKLIKIIDDSQSPAPPTITAQAPTSAKVREDVRFSVRAADDGVPALAYHWDFGDGVSSEGADQTHTYTLAGAYTVRLTVNGVDGVSVQKRFAITVDGLMEIGQPRRYAEAAPEPGSINE